MLLEKLVVVHLRKDCLGDPVFCEFNINGCPKIVLRKDIENHSIVCDFRSVIYCKVCGTGVTRTNQVLHNPDAIGHISFLSEELKGS